MRNLRESDNVFLKGNWYPVDESSSDNLEVIGEIPQELNGLFLRNGPNPKEPIDHKNYHPFFGDGMIHGLKIENGKALWYKNRYVESSFGFGPNTHVMKHADKIYALVEGGSSPVILDSNLNFTDEIPFSKNKEKRFTAHPKFDATKNELHAISYDFSEYVSEINQVHYRVVDDKGEISTDIPIILNSKPMIHDCAITENYVLIFDLPVTFNTSRRTDNKDGSDYPVIWDDKYQSKLGLLNRHSSEIKWIEVPKCFLFHVVNSYENKSGKIILDFCRYEKLFDFDNPLPFGNKPFLTRWEIDIAKGSCTEKILDDRPMEFARIHPELDGKEHRFSYILNDGSLNNLFKYDFLKDSNEVHNLGENRKGAEPVFIPKTNSSAEDDGYVVGFVYDQDTDRSEFIIIDAENFSKTPLARVILPSRVPFGFHGSWINLVE